MLFVVLSLRSHPAWVCGLKPVNTAAYTRIKESHPAWVCGLKLNTNLTADDSQAVTPCVGVWIETKDKALRDYYKWSHPAWVCGLKLRMSCPYGKQVRHTLRGCVD